MGRFILLAGALLLTASLGCAMPPRSARDGMATGALVAAARARGLALEDPLKLDGQIERMADESVGRHGSPQQRLHDLASFLEQNGLGFRQLSGVTLPARQAFHERRGDCMTYAMLFVALSRHLGVETYFVHASQVRAYYERGDSLYAASHVAVGWGEHPGAIVIDFFDDVATYGLSAYRRIDDASAVSLYYSNVAVGEMNAGRVERAERLLRFLADTRPALPELANNLAVALLRKREHAQALEVLEGAMRSFPEYKPLYTNGVQAALGVGDAELARVYYARGADITGNDPLFAFARALQLYQRAEYGEAATHFERALRSQEDSVVIVTWLVRAHLSAGNRVEGREAFWRARRRTPDDLRLKQLELRYPELRPAGDTP